MRIKLERLLISNFKGIKDLVIDFTEKKTLIVGNNETGKTTIADAFFWVMFGKDSSFRTKFDISPLDKNNQIIECTTAVTAIISNDGVRHNLTKELIPNAEKGNSIDYYLENAPVKKNEYSSFVSSLISEEKFKLLTSTTYFNEQMEWKERRDILTSLITKVSYEDIVEQKPFAAIREDVSSLGIERTEDKYKHLYKKVKEQIQSIPARIDEVSKNINTHSDDSLLEINLRREEIKAKIKELQEQSSIEYIENGNRLRESLSVINKQISEEDDGGLRIENLKKAEKTLDIEHQNIMAKIKTLNGEIKRNNDTISLLEEERDELRKSYIEVNNKVFDDSSEICPTCKQVLPPNLRKEAEESFFKNKEKKLESFKKQAGDIKVTVINLAKENEGKAQLLENALEELESVKTSIKNNKNLLSNEETSFTKNTKLAQLEEKKRDIEESLKSLKPNIYLNEIDILEFEYNNLNKELSGHDSSEKAKKRIEELEYELSKANEELLEIEKKVSLTSRLIVKYVETVETELNQLFDRKIKIRLFERQLNGIYKETCDVLVLNKQGALVPWQYVNTAGQINASLQIINILSKHLNTYCPVFIDHAESVGEIFEIDSQTIELKFLLTYQEITIK